MSQLLIYITICVAFFESVNGIINLPLKRRNLQQHYSQQIITKPLLNLLHIHYDTYIYVGNNREEFRVIIDTGSTLLWIPSSQCDVCNNYGLWKKYDCQSSKTCQTLLEEPQQINYGLGNVEGTISSELIYFDQSGQGQGIQLPLLLVNSVDHFDKFKGQGIIGLGRKEDSEFNLTILDALKEQDLIQNKVFSMFLTDESCTESSALTLGGFDSRYFEGEINYVKTAVTSYWGVPLSSFHMVQSSQSVSLDLKAKIAILDSGTTKITFPHSDIEQLIKFFQKYEIHCEAVENWQNVNEILCKEYKYNNYPNIIFELGQIQFILQPEEYIEQCFLKYNGIWCRLKIQELDLDDIDCVILGDVFMKKYYIIFDQDNARIGFAVSAKQQSSMSSITVSLIGTYGIILFVLLSGLAVCLSAQIYWNKQTINIQISDTENSAPSGQTLELSDQIEHIDEHEESNEKSQEMSEELGGDQNKQYEHEDAQQQ